MSGGTSELDALDKKELRHRWQRAYGGAPPPRLGRDMMLLALGWSAQAKTHGGFNRETREYLARFVANLKAGRNITSGASEVHSSLSPGMSLVREWHGTLHQVLVLDKGYVWNDRVWNSLSAIARQITGARWNGPAFFGLRSKRVISQEKKVPVDEYPSSSAGVRP